VEIKIEPSTEPTYITVRIVEVKGKGRVPRIGFDTPSPKDEVLIYRGETLEKMKEGGYDW
jgi:sRNA-binding carbon storage regulator CsrA